MSLETRVHELAALVAEQGEEIARLTALVDRLLAAPAPEVQAPVVNVTVPPAAIPDMPPAPVPRVTVDAPVSVTVPPPGDCVITHEWGMERGHFVPVRSYVSRRRP